MQEVFFQPPSDPVGMALGWVVLGGMVIALAVASWRLTNAWQYGVGITKTRDPIDSGRGSLVPLLALAGLGISIYLAYVEVTHAEAVCGPIGNCNLVQSSDYARFMGVPVAALGIINYVAIGLMWAGLRFAGPQTARLSSLGLLGLTLFGLLFSIYLTWVEIFILHAICIYCITSAVIATGLMLAVVLPLTGMPAPATD
ncbi:MAG: vitamin K epoxide reductase family protein [Anaerolineae bacterium]